MTGYVTGDLIDPGGADELVATAEQSIAVAARLGIPRLNLHGTGLDSRGLPKKPVEVITGEMWLTAEHTGQDRRAWSARGSDLLPGEPQHRC